MNENEKVLNDERVQTRKKNMRNQHNFRKYVLIISIISIIVIGFGTLFFFYKSDGLDGNAIMATSDNLTKEEIKEKMKNKADKNLIVASMNTTPTFKTGEDKGNLNIEISPRNYYAMRVEITLDKDKSMVYKSDRIDPGYMIKEAKLDKKLDKGNYMCTATFIALDQENDYKEVRRISTQIEVKVEK